MKTCTKCKTEQPLSEFYKRSTSPDGKETRCKTCAKASAKLRRETHPEKVAAEKRRWEANNPEAVRAHGRKHSRAYYQRMDKEERTAYNRKTYEGRDRAKIYAKNAKYRAVKLNAIPAWADMEAIDFVYHTAKAIEEEYGTKWHVDHIVPLQGDSVCGLHVAGNLQLLSPEENISKSNKW